MTQINRSSVYKMYVDKISQPNLILVGNQSFIYTQKRVLFYFIP